MLTFVKSYWRNETTWKRNTCINNSICAHTVQIKASLKFLIVLFLLFLINDLWPNYLISAQLYREVCWESEDM